MMTKAFPSTQPLYSPEKGSTIGRQEHSGMDLRDWFAGLAMEGIAFECLSPEQTAKAAYQMADAMMEARNAKT